MKQYKRKLRRDLTGKTFYGIKAVSLSHRDSGGKAIWNFICHCDKTFKCGGHEISSGHSKSCGCQKGVRKHLMSNSRLYNIWVGMKQRCLNKKCVSYHKYGGRGINVCNDWLDFERFLTDMKQSYDKHVNTYGENQTSLDRINNMNGYSKENCRWTTTKEQARNTRTNTLLTFNNQTKSVSQWGEDLDINVGTLFARIRYGWSVKDTLTKPVQYKS